MKISLKPRQIQIQIMWSPVYDDAFKKLANVISTPPILLYYDLNEEVTIETDIRDPKLGAVLIQGAGLVAFARHSITDERDFLFSTGSRSWPHTFRRGKSTAVTDHKRTGEVTTYDTSTAKVPPQFYIMQESNTNVHQRSLVQD